MTTISRNLYSSDLSRSRSKHGRQFLDGKLQRNLFFCLVSGSCPSHSREREVQSDKLDKNINLHSRQTEFPGNEINLYLMSKNLFFTTCFSHSTSIDRSRIDDGRHIVTTTIILALIIRMME